MKRFRVLIAVTILVGLGVLLYFHLSNKTDGDNIYIDDNSEVTEVFKVINKDLENKYPKTPSEVINFYARIQSCYYNESYSEADLKRLMEQARELLDEELLDVNSYDEFYKNLTEDIKQYKKDKKVISKYLITKNSEVEYYEYEDREFAVVYCVYYLKSPEGTEKTYQRYILKKDEKKLWRILRFELVRPLEED